MTTPKPISLCILLLLLFVYGGDGRINLRMLDFYSVHTRAFLVASSLFATTKQIRLCVSHLEIHSSAFLVGSPEENSINLDIITTITIHATNHNNKCARVRLLLL